MSGPSVRRIAIRPYRPEVKGLIAPATLYRLGVVDASGDWEAPQPQVGEITFTQTEAWARAAILGLVTGLPIEEVDFKPDGSVVPTHPAFYMKEAGQR